MPDGIQILGVYTHVTDCRGEGGGEDGDFTCSYACFMMACNFSFQIKTIFRPIKPQRLMNRLLSEYFYHLLKFILPVVPFKYGKAHDARLHITVVGQIKEDVQRRLAAQLPCRYRLPE